MVRTNVIIRNISHEKHLNIYFPKRLFQHHNKHDNKRSNLNDGQSTLFYSIPVDQSIVQKFLDIALGKLHSSSGKLFSYDVEKKLFIEFQMHLKNTYHGYHILDKTRVPYQIRQKFQ